MSQIEKLKKLLEYIWSFESEYKQKMIQTGIKPEDIKKISDISKLPFTTKEEMRKKYPHSFRIKSIEEVTEIHTTSGTTGTESIVYFTEKDWDKGQELVAKMMRQAGITSKEIVDQAFPNGMPFAGKINHDALQYKIGATVINVGIGKGLINQHILAMKELGATVFMGLPSYFLHLLNEMEKRGIKLKDLKLKKSIFIGEPLIEEVKEKIKEKLPLIDIYNALGQTEMHGAIGECKEKKGFHIDEEEYIHEIINPETGEIVPEGEYGEHVFTGLTYEAQPLIRYRSGDITKIIPECRCGKGRKIESPKKRADNHYKIKGVLVNPEHIDKLLLSKKGILDYQIRIYKEEELDKFDLKIAGEINEEEIKKIIKENINITPTKIKNVKLMDLKESWKTKKVIDER